MPRKPKTQQNENVEGVSGRDLFQTPNYATDIIVPFLRYVKGEDRHFRVWECAAGLRKMARRLNENRFDVLQTDLQDGFNFLTDVMSFPFDCIVTNTPFSLKKKFFLKCLEYNVPFALLIPADYSGWIIEAVNNYGCEKIIPTRRIDYITPNTLQRIWEGETFEMLNDAGQNEEELTLEQYKESLPLTWSGAMASTEDRFSFESIYEAPASLLRKYSSSYFHSMWLTRYFGLGRSETFVELTNEQKNNI